MPKQEKFFDIKPPKRFIQQRHGSRTPKKLIRKPRSFPSFPRFAFALPDFKKVRFSLFLIPTLLVLALGFYFLNRSAAAEIEIWPHTKAWESEEEFRVDIEVADINLSEKVIPGFLFSREGELSDEFPASGISAKGSKASGKITVYNNYYLTQVLVANTRFLSAEGKLFRSVERVSIPAEGQLEITVVAAEPGPGYNIKPTTFSVPGLVGSARYTQVYAKSFNPMQGGFSGEVTQATKEDLSQAEKTLTRQLSQDLKGKIQEIADTSLVLMPEAVQEEVLGGISSVQPGAEADQFTYSVEMKTQALAFKQSDLENLARNLIAAESAEPQKLYPNSLQMDFSAEEVDLEQGKMSLDVKIKARIYSDSDLEALKKALAGKSVKATQVLLQSYPEIEKSQIHLWPFWIDEIPDDLNKIELKMKLD